MQLTKSTSSASDILFPDQVISKPFCMGILQTFGIAVMHILNVQT